MRLPRARILKHSRKREPSLLDSGTRILTGAKLGGRGVGGGVRCPMPRPPSSESVVGSLVGKHPSCGIVKPCWGISMPVGPWKLVPAFLQASSSLDDLAF